MTNDVTEQDYVDFFGKTRAEVLDIAGKDVVDSTARREAFNRQVKEITYAELVKHYGSWEYLSVIHARAICPEYFRMVEGWGDMDSYDIQTIKQACGKGVRVFDYGCGPAQLGIFAASCGADVTLMDVDTRGFTFLSHLCAKYRPHIECRILRTDYDDLGDPYDFLICRDVFEHLLDPAGVLRNIAKHMKVGGKALLGVFFDDMNGHDPAHLKRNNVYGDYKGKWLPELEAAGFVEEGYDYTPTPRLFRLARRVSQ